MKPALSKQGWWWWGSQPGRHDPHNPRPASRSHTASIRDSSPAGKRCRARSLAQQEPSQSWLLLLPARQRGRGAGKGTPSRAPRPPLTDARRRAGKPGLERRGARPPGPQSRVRGGERGRPPRPSWEAPGAWSRFPAALPRPGHVPAGRPPARLRGTKAVVGSHAHKAASPAPRRPLSRSPPPPAARPSAARPNKGRARGTHRNMSTH